MTAVLDFIVPVATTLLGAGGGTTIALALIRRGENRDRDAAKVTAVEAREETARHRIADGAHAREGTVLERLHDDCRREVAEAREKIESLFDANATTQVELTKVVGQLVRCEEQHEEQRRVSASLSDRLSRLERRSDPPAMEPAE